MLTWKTLTLRLQNPFRVAYGVSHSRQAFWLRLDNDEGWGEGTIPPYYDVQTAAMERFWADVARRKDTLPEEPQAIAQWVGEAGPAPARAALDLALYDRLGRRHGQSLTRLLSLRPPTNKATSITIGLDSPQNMAAAASRLNSYPMLKAKLGGEDDLACVRAIRQARPDAQLLVDANAAWTEEVALRYIDALVSYDVKLIEQPLAADNIDGLGRLQAQCAIPIVADESLQSVAGIDRIAAAGVRGVNLKIMKLGGLSPTLKALNRAIELGLRVMLGCMVETSLGVTAIGHLAGYAEWLDLDAPLLIANDPFEGLVFDKSGQFSLPERPGIGVILREEI